MEEVCKSHIVIYVFHCPSHHQQKSTIPRPCHATTDALNTVYTQPCHQCYICHQKRLVFKQPFQVWSLSSLEVRRQLSTNDLNQVSFVSLLMTSLTVFTNEGLFELTRRPSLTQAVSLSFAETTKVSGGSHVKKLKYD